MPYIISAGTHVYIGTGEETGIQSVNLGLSPQIQRLYALGGGIYDTTVINQLSLSLTMYGQGNTPKHTFSQHAATGCTPAATVLISILTNPCGNEDEISVSDHWYITSYSYSKEAQNWGIESYSFVTAPISSGPPPTMVAGTPEGQTTVNGGAKTGIRFIEPQGGIEGYTLEVTAGSPGIGKAFNVTYGEVSSVVGGTGKLDGTEGNGSVNFPYSTLYLGS